MDRRAGASMWLLHIGQIMATSALLSKNLKPSESEIENKISNICRCGNYVRLRKAIRRSAKLIQKQGAQDGKKFPLT
ncbi:MAG: hypothetical protein CM1200mP11_4420 [Nitrosopumilaceae archaeon]|nr:MAG: hypothetical protein CM1200mP11_4420 [Nitrosopumilaceae archaeon]